MCMTVTPLQHHNQTWISQVFGIGVNPKTATNRRRKRSAAAKYPLSDAHEMLLRPSDGKKRRQQPTKPPKKRKKPGLTDKQRTQFAREHYARHHGPRVPPPVENNPSPLSPPIVWTPPTTLGHHQHNTNTDLDSTVAPINFLDFLNDYSPEADRKALQDLSNL